MRSLKKCLLSLGFVALLGAAPASIMLMPSPAQAQSEIKIVVNKLPITSYDIQRRAAFLRLQRRSGNINQQAEEEMIDQAVRFAEINRLGIRTTDQMVNEAYARFAASNKMTAKQLDTILTQSGVTPKHFKTFISAQMGWGQVLQAKGRQGGIGTGVTERDAVRRMQQQGGAKPSATEYMLQQVIFVVPQAERGKIAQRKREAEALRSRFAGCAQTREFAKGLVDVTVRDLGRKFGPELPGDWAEQIKVTKVGSATPVRETDRGVEFIGVCSSREVSDDRVAQMVFQAESLTNQQEDDLSKKLTAELREKARIQRR